MTTINTLIDALERSGGAWWNYAFSVAWQATLLAILILAILHIGRRWPAPAVVVAYAAHRGAARVDEKDLVIVISQAPEKRTQGLVDGVGGG